LADRPSQDNDRPHRVEGVLERQDPTGEPVPVVFDCPHSGDRYPADFDYAVSLEALRSTEDMYVDDLFGQAPRQGATLLRALFPRSYIDVNRRPEDIDASLLAEPWPGELRPGGKTANGKGLLRAQAMGLPIYRRPLAVREVRTRLDRYYHPYHDALAAIIGHQHSRFGAVWHVNCHSWTPPASGRDGKPVRHVDFFLGDRDGTTAQPEFTAGVAGYLRALGYEVRVNRLFKGMEIVRRHGRPALGQHSLQIEINRNLYMDKHGYHRLEGYSRLRGHLTGLIAVVCEHARRHCPDPTP